MFLECNKVISKELQYMRKGDEKFMEELIGYVASNHKASKILNVLDSKGAMDGATIAKTVRIVGADKIIEELAGKSLIVREGTKFALTDLGKQVSHKLRSV
jgi:predicted transcriptional regulator